MKNYSFPFIVIFILIAATACKKNNTAPSVEDICDTSQISYSKNIKVILNSNCYACHSTQMADSTGINDLEKFSALKLYLENDYQADGVYGSEFMHIINQNGNVPDMPPYGKLSPCDILKINRWIQNGAQEN